MMMVTRPIAAGLMRNATFRGLLTRWLPTQRPIFINGGARYSLASAPGLVKTVFMRLGTVLGLGAIADFFIPGDLFPTFGIESVLGGGGGGSDLPPGWTSDSVAKRWSANGTPFVMSSDGRIAARKKEGTWSIWRPKKPIVLMPGGASDLKTLLAADKSVDRQLRRIQKVLRRRYPAPRKPPSSRPPGGTGRPAVIIESGPGNVVS